MTREDVVKECADRLRPLGMIALAASFVDGGDTDLEQLIALGPLERLASSIAHRMGSLPACRSMQVITARYCAMDLVRPCPCRSASMASGGG